MHLVDDMEPGPSRGLFIELCSKIEGLEKIAKEQRKAIKNLCKITKEQNRQLKIQNSTLRFREQLNKLNIDCSSPCDSGDKPGVDSPSYVKSTESPVPSAQVTDPDGQPCSSFQNRAKEERLLMAVSPKVVDSPVEKLPLSTYPMQKVQENSNSCNVLLRNMQTSPSDGDRDYVNIDDRKDLPSHTQVAPSRDYPRVSPTSEEKAQLDLLECVIN